MIEPVENTAPLPGASKNVMSARISLGAGSSAHVTRCVSCSSGTSTHGASGLWPSDRASTIGVRRRSEPVIRAVELEARRTVARKAEIADLLVAHAVQNPRRARRQRVLAAAIIGADEIALRRETDTDQTLRRPAVAPPQAAVFAVEGVVVFAGLGRPGADATLPAPDLDRAGHLLVPRDLPVEAVAAEVDETPATVAIGLQRIEHGAGVILRMRPRHHCPIGLR